MAIAMACFNALCTMRSIGILDILLALYSVMTAQLSTMSYCLITSIEHWGSVACPGHEGMEVLTGTVGLG